MEAVNIVPEIRPRTLLEHATDELIVEFKNISRRFATVDPVLAAISYALFFEGTINPEFRDVLEDVMKNRHEGIEDQPDSPDALKKIILSEDAGIFKTTLINDRRHVGERPELCDDWQEWQSHIRELVEYYNMKEPDSIRSVRADRITINLWTGAATTNPFSRAIPDELIMQALAPRFPDGYTVLGIGEALCEVPKQILMKHKYPFDEVSLFEVQGRVEQRVNWQEQAQLSHTANRLLGRSHLIEKYVAIDLIDMRRSVDGQLWTRDCLRPTSEQADREFMCKFLGLAREEPPELSVHQVDFTSPHDIRKFHQQIGESQWDVVSASTVHSQLPVGDRKIMDKHILEAVRPGGFAIKKDFFWTNGKHNNRAQYFQRWHMPGRYRTHIYDTLSPERGWQPVFMSDSRCYELAVASGRILMGSNYERIDDLIQAA